MFCGLSANQVYESFVSQPDSLENGKEIYEPCPNSFFLFFFFVITLTRDNFVCKGSEANLERKPNFYVGVDRPCIKPTLVDGVGPIKRKNTRLGCNFFFYFFIYLYPSKARMGIT